MSDALPDRFDYSCHIDTQHQRQRMPGVCGVACANLRVQRVQTARFNTDQYLPGLRSRAREFREFERTVIAVQNQRLHVHDFYPVDRANLLDSSSSMREITTIDVIARRPNVSA